MIDVLKERTKEKNKAIVFIKLIIIIVTKGVTKMTSYQKLKIENQILWKKLDTIWMLHHNEEVTKKMLEDVKWEIKRAQHENKN